jgi:hypothetical protein
MVLNLLLLALLIAFATWLWWPFITSVYRRCRPTTLKSIKGAFLVPDTIEDATKTTDLLAFGTFSNPASTRLLASNEYTVVVTNHADGSAVTLVDAKTTVDHSVTVNGTAEDVPVGSDVWQTPKEVFGVELDAKFTAPGPNGTVIEDDETYTFTGGQPFLVGLAGVSVQE